jgi:hypothetical protein
MLECVIEDHDVALTRCSDVDLEENIIAVSRTLDDGGEVVPSKP